MVSFCKNFHFSKLLAQNAKGFGVSDKINVIYADFEEYNKVKSPDIIFLNTAYLFDQSDMGSNRFSIFESVDPDLALIIEKALLISKNFVMILPHNADISEISNIFWNFYEKHKKVPSISIKCEFLKINDKLEVFVIYSGEISEVLIKINNFPFFYSSDSRKRRTRTF